MTLKERLARPGFAVSALAHAGALVATLVAFSSNERFQDEQETVPIAVITTNQFNQIMKGDKAAKEVRPDATAATEQVAALEASQPPPPPPAAAAPPPPPPPPDETPPTPPERPVEATPLPPVPTPPVRDADVVLPKPVPKPMPKPVEKPPVVPPKPVALKPLPRPKPPEKPVEKPKPDLLAKLMQEQPPDEVQPRPTPAPPRKPAPEAKAAPQESHFDITDITKLFTTRDAPAQKGSMAHDTSRVASLGSPTASAPKMSPSFWAGLDGLMEDQYRKCWSYLGLTTGQKYIPQVRVVYGSDGSLQGQPVLINPPSNPSLQGLAESALRAVRHCNPLKIPEQYAPFFDEWKGRVLRFDPEEMAG